ncbi:DNA repair protein RadC [Gallibacterium trehalosifermentans]|uniref:DNA repair protein RadC n=1 Tax=Gallibacterium trehalosifermentans TaxID=516935 RepID=A0ABV6GZR9_9PAST
MMSKLMPREKLLQQGATSLSDQELLAIFLRTGFKNCSVMALAEQALTHFGSLRELLSASEIEFCQVKGLGITQYIQLQACIEMTKRYLSEELKQQPVFNNIEFAKLYMQSELSMQQREIFVVLFLDNQHHLIQKEVLFQGTINSTQIHPREIIKSALQHNAAALILSHNHPSGIVTPSTQDIEITKEIKNICQLIDVKVLDHLIVGKNKVFSFCEEGLMG